MKIFGNPEALNPDGTSIELRFSVAGNMVATVHNNCVANFTLHQKVSGVTVVEVQLAGVGGLSVSSLPRVADIEAWSHRKEGPSHLLATVSIDYYNSTHNADTVQVSIHGRSVCAGLIDSRCDLNEPNTNLRDLIVCIGGDKVAVSGSVLNEPVSAYIASPSAFGALRLLATSRELVVKDESLVFRVRSRSEARAELAKQSVATITSEETLSGEITKGSPIRRR